MAHDVFISHSSKDKTTADAVCATLESNGVRCWIAPRDVTPSSEYGECIIEAIKECRIMVLVFTADANASPQIRREVERAVNHGVAILPFRVQDVVPGSALEYFIGNVHWLDALTPPLENHLQNLTETVKALLAKIPARDAGQPDAPAQPAVVAPPKSVFVSPASPAKAKPSSPSRYLLWAAGAIAILCASVYVTLKVKSSEPTRVRVPIHFAVPTTEASLPDLGFAVTAPEPISEVGLRAKSEDPFPYWYEGDIPTSGDADFVAEINHWAVSSRHVGTGFAYDYRICLKTNPNHRPPVVSPPDNATKDPVQLTCSADGHCLTAKNAPEYVMSCESSASALRFTDGLGLSFVAHADGTSGQTRAAGWVVPSIETLDKMTDRERTGYTRFEVTFVPTSVVAGADTYYVALFVNGEPIYVDGFLPDRIRFPMQQGTTNQISFALENLNFTGQDKGYEDLRLVTSFLKNGKPVYQQAVERKYIALRDAPQESTPTAAGTFNWAGTYVVPKNENKYEILLASSSNVDLAMNAKAEFDHAKLSFDQLPVTMVVRPPLRPEKPSYGLALGVVLASSQVQFTFNTDEAAKFCHWAAQQVGQGAGGKLIRPDLNRYEVSDRNYSPCR